MTKADGELAARVRRVVETIGTQADAARIARVSLRQMKKYLSGNTRISAKAAAPLCTETGFSLDWLLLGEGPERGPRKARDSKGVRLLAEELVNEAVGGADAFTVLGLLVASGLFSVYQAEGFPLDELDVEAAHAIARDTVPAFQKLERDRWAVAAPALLESQRAALRHVRARREFGEDGG